MSTQERSDGEMDLLAAQRDEALAALKALAAAYRALQQLLIALTSGVFGE